MSRPIYFVSLGPGDAELITLKSLHALQQADIIYCPSTVREPDKILSRAATLLHKLGIKGDIHLFSLPMSKDRTKAIKVYRQLFEEMRLEQKAGKRLAVAVEGDAGIYASVHYVLDLLEENGIPRRATSRYSFIHRCGSGRKTTSHQPKRKTGHYSGQYYFGRTGHVSEPSSCAGYHEIISMCRHSTGLHGVPPPIQLSLF